LAQGQVFDALQYSTVSNAVRRLLADLGLERRARVCLHSKLIDQLPNRNSKTLPNVLLRTPCG
jgi:hypothetical protein